MFIIYILTPVNRLVLCASGHIPEPCSLYTIWEVQFLPERLFWYFVMYHFLRSTYAYSEASDKMQKSEDLSESSLHVFVNVKIQ